MDGPLSNAKGGDGAAVSGPPPAQVTCLSAAPVVGASGSRRDSRNRSPGLNATTSRSNGRSNGRSTSGSGVTVGGAHPGVKCAGAVAPAAALKAFGMRRHSGSDALTSPLPPGVPSAPEAPLKKPRRGMGEAVASRDSSACVSSLSVGISIPSHAPDDTPPVPTKEKKSNEQTPQSELSGQQSPNCRAARTSRVPHGRIGVSAQLRRLGVTNCNNHASLLSGSGSRIGCSPVLREFTRGSFSLATASDDHALKEDSACGQRGGTTATSSLSLSSSSTARRRHSLMPHNTDAKYGARTALIPTPLAVAAVGASSSSPPHDLGDGSRPDSHAPAYHGSDAARRPSLLAGVHTAHVSTGGVGGEGRGEGGCAQLPSVSRAGLSSLPFARCPSLVSSTNAGGLRGGPAKRSLAGCPFAATQPTSRSPSLSFADVTTGANTSAFSPSSHTESTMAFGTSATVMALASATGTAAMSRLDNAAVKKPLMTSAVVSPHLMVPQRLARSASGLPATTCSAATTSTIHTATRNPKIISEAALTTSTTATSVTPTKGRRFNLRLSMFPVTASVATTTTTTTTTTTAADCRAGSALPDATHAITESAAVAVMTRASATAQHTVLEPLTSPSSSKSVASGITSAMSPDKLHPGRDSAQLCRRLRGSSELVASMPSMPSPPAHFSGRTPLAEVSTSMRGSHQPSPTQLSRQSQPVGDVSKEGGSTVDMPVLTGRAASAHIPDAPPAASAAPPPPPPLMRSSLSSVRPSSAVNPSFVRRQGSMPLFSASHAGAAVTEAIGDGHGGQEASMIAKCGSAASPPRMPHHPQHASSEDGAASKTEALEVHARGTESPHLRSTTIASKLSASGGGGTQYEAPPTLSSLDTVDADEEEGGVGADVVFVDGSSPLGGKPLSVPAHHSSGSNDRDDAAAPRGGVPRSHNRLSLEVALFPQTTPLQSVLSTTPSRAKASSSAAGQRGLRTLFAEPPSAPLAATEAPADPNGDCGGSAVAAARDVPRLREGTGIGTMPSILAACPADFGGGMGTTHLSGRLHAGLPALPDAPTRSPRLGEAERGLQHQDGTAPPPTFSSHKAEVPVLAACASSADGADVVARAKDAAAAKAMPPSSRSTGPLAGSGLATPLRTIPGRPKPGTSGSCIDSRLCTPSSDTSFLESKAGRLIYSSARSSVPTAPLVSTTQLPSNSATALLPTQGLATPRAPSAYPCGTHSSPTTLSSVSSSAASSLLMRGAAAKSPTAGASRPRPSPPHLAAAAAAAAPTPSTASDIAPVALLALADVASLSPRPASLGDGNKVALAVAQHRLTLDALAAGTSRSTAGSVSMRQTTSLSPFPPAKAPDDDTTTWVTPRSGSNSRVAVSTRNPPQRAGVFPSMPPPPSLSSTAGVSSLASHGVRPTTTANAHRFCGCSDGSLSDVGGTILTHRFVSSSRHVFDAPTTPKPPLHTGTSAATAATAGAAGSSSDVTSDDVIVAVATSRGHDEPPAHDSLTLTEDVKGDERAAVGGGGNGADAVSTEAGCAAQKPAHTQKTESSLSSGRGNSTGGSGGDGGHHPTVARSFSGQEAPTHRAATDNTAHHLSAACVVELPVCRPIAYLSAEKKREPHCRHHDDSKQPQQIEQMTSSHTAQSDSGAGRPRLTSLSSMTASANGDPLHLSTSACSSSKDVPATPSQRIVMDGGDDSPRRLHKSKMPSLLAVDRLVLWLRSTAEKGKPLMVGSSAEVDIGADGSATEGPGADSQLQASSTTAVDTLAVSSAKGTTLRGNASKTMSCADGSSTSTNSPLLVRDGTRAGPSMCAPSLVKQCCFGDLHTTAHIAPTVPNAAAVVTATALSLRLSQSSTLSVHASIPADVGGTLCDGNGALSRAPLRGMALCGSLDARDSVCPLAVPSLPAGCQPHRQRAASTLGRGGPHAETMGSSKGVRVIVDKNASAAECDRETDETRGAAAEFSASTAAAAAQPSVAQGDHNARSSSRLSVAPSAPSDTAKAAEAAAGCRSVASAPASTQVRGAGDTHANGRCGGGSSRPLPLSSAMTSDGHRTDAAASHTQSQLHESSNRSLPTLRSTFLGSVQGEIKRWAMAVLRRHRNSRSSGRRIGTEKDGAGSEVSSSSQASSLCVPTRDGRNHPPAAWKAPEVKSVGPLYAGQGQQAYNLFQSGVGVVMANGPGAAPLLMPARPLVPAASSLSEAPLPGARGNCASWSSSATSRSSFIHTAPLTPLFYSVLDFAAASADDGGPHTAEVSYSVFGSAARAFRRRFSSAIAGGDGTKTPEHKRASDATTTSGSLASLRIRHAASPASSTVVVPPGARNSVITLAAAAQRNVFRGTPLSRRTFLSALSGTTAPTLDAAGDTDGISLAPPMPDLPACPIATKTVPMLQPGSDQPSGWASTLCVTDSTAISLSTTMPSPSSSSLRTTQPSGSSGAAAATALPPLSPEPKYAPTPTNAAGGAQSPGSASRLLERRRRHHRSTGDREDPLGGTAAHQNFKADRHDQPPHHSCHLAAARLSLEPQPQNTRAPATARRPFSGCYGEDTTTIASMSRRGSAAVTLEGCGSNAVVVLDAAHASALHTLLAPSTRCVATTTPAVAAKTSCRRRGGNRRFSAGRSPLHPLSEHERWPVPTEKAESASVAHDKMPLQSMLATAAMPAPQTTSAWATASTITTSAPYSVSLTDMSSGGGFERGAAGDPVTADATANRACGTLSNSAAAPSSWQRSHTGSVDGGKANVAATTSSHVIAPPFAPSSSLPFMDSAGPAHRSSGSSGSIAGGGAGSVSRASVVTATAPSTGADKGRSDADATNENAATPPSAATRTAGANYSPPPLLSCDASPALFHLSSPLAFLHDRNESFTSGGIPALMLDGHERNSQLSSQKRPRSDTGLPQPAALCGAAARGSVSRHQQQRWRCTSPHVAPHSSGRVVPQRLQPRRRGDER